MKPQSRAAGRRQITLELTPQAIARMEMLAAGLDCSKVEVVKRALALFKLACTERLQTQAGKTIIVI